MRITKEQSDILKSFKCERLSANSMNKVLMKSFTSKRGASLVSYVTRLGMKEEDEDRITCGNSLIALENK